MNMKNRLWKKRFGIEKVDIQKRESFSIFQDRNKTDFERNFFASVASASEELNNCLIQIESQLLETNVIHNSTEIMNISAVPLDLPYEAFLPREEEIQGTSDFSTSNETIVFLATEIANKVGKGINKKVAAFDYITLATAIADRLSLPEFNLDKYGLFEKIIQNTVKESFRNAVSELDSKVVWVKPQEYMRKYGLSPSTLHRYVVNGIISEKAISGSGKGRRYDISVKPLK